MDRRSFIINSTLTGAFFYISEIKKAHALGSWDQKSEFYSMFKDPTSIYRPFVRWWWNGDKVQAPEINRELKLLKDAGIGGVEINPIEFPKNADSMGIKSLEWLSDEWIDLVKEACNFGKSLDMHSDLIVGSGWPFGSEELEEDERAEVLIVYAKKLDGPTIFETSRFNIWQEVDPGVTVKNTLRQPEVVSLSLVKDQMNSLEDATDLSSQKEQDLIHVEVPDGPHYFYAVVKYQSFADVINGAPGAAGSILDHMNKNAVQKYLNRMSDKMQNRIGALSNYLRALFHDSMELEGSNWTGDFDKEFKQRCGYDVRPYLPYIMFKVGRLGNVVDENYGAQKTESFAQTLDRVRFDFEFVKASLLKERFTDTYVEWCKNLGVKSRAQGYGRGFFRLLPSMQFDIPEGESWTTNYLLHKLGEEMSDEDYRRGRGYTMINKYVSSAAHLAGKREVSCEEMTDTYLVFNTTLELLKVGSDQSIMSGITHSVWAGFNYSPKDAPFPGWIQYGPYLNEKNNFWPYFHLLNDYKARLSSQLENADQYADIAILPADFDLWSDHGVQTDPFPQIPDTPYTSLLWEAISKTGGAADYITEFILKDAVIKKGKIQYGKRSYGVLFLPEVSSMWIDSLRKILEFVKGGGRVYSIDHAPHKSLGLSNIEEKSEKVKKIVSEIKSFKDSFKIIPKPIDNRILEWYDDLKDKENLPKYLTIQYPDRYFMQNRYLRNDGSEFYFFQNANRLNPHVTRIIFNKSVAKGKNSWIWNTETGNRYKLELDKSCGFEHNFGPTESLFVVFDKEKTDAAEPFSPLPVDGYDSRSLNEKWKIELDHSVEKSLQQFDLDRLIDMKNDPRLVNFTGTAVYTKKIDVEKTEKTILNLGKVYGISELWINDQLVGTKWYGRRMFEVSNFLKEGNNEIKVKMITTMGNYLKTLKGNKGVQAWINRNGREQEIQSMGLVGPVNLYHY